MLKGNHWLVRMLLGSALSVGAMVPSVAEELVSDEPTGGDATTTQQFNSRERLISTLLADDQAAVTEAQAAVVETQAALDEATASGASEEELVAFRAALSASTVELTEAETQQAAERDRLTVIAGSSELTDEQVFMLNRSLNNAVASKLTVDFDANDLQAVVDGNYNAQQIKAFTSALEQEARFESKSDRFADKYEATGDDKFAAKADAMSAKALDQSEKFRAKVDRFASPPTAIESDIEAEMKSNVGNAPLREHAAKDSAREFAKEQAKETAKQQAKEQAKDNARQISKQIAQEQGRDVKGNSAKNEIAKQARDLAKQQGKDAKDKI